MHENLNAKQEKASEDAENTDVALMSEDELNAALTRVNKRILVTEELAEKPGLASETILEERRKLDARKATIKEALKNLEDPFSGAVGAAESETVLRKIEQARDNKLQ